MMGGKLACPGHSLELQTLYPEGHEGWAHHLMSQRRALWLGQEKNRLQDTCLHPQIQILCSYDKSSSAPNKYGCPVSPSVSQPKRFQRPLQCPPSVVALRQWQSLWKKACQGLNLGGDKSGQIIYIHHFFPSPHWSMSGSSRRGK